MEERAPALDWTTTLWPASTSAFTPEGTIPTRVSWSFTSLGTPINMGCASFRRLFRIVNLSALQAVRVINVNGLPLRVKIDCAQAAFAMAVARGLGSAEREMYFRADGRRVHIGDSGIDVAHSAERLLNVTGVKGGG